MNIFGSFYDLGVWCGEMGVLLREGGARFDMRI
jgi:hypothetical protein